jgi:hypothetical protein
MPESKRAVNRTPAWIPFVLILMLLAVIGLVVYFVVVPLFYSAPVITMQPEDKRVTPDESVTLRITAVGNPTPTYQWQVQPVLSTTWNNIDGATDTTYTFTAQASDQASMYRVVVTNSTGTTSSQVWIITVTLPPVMVSYSPALLTVQAGMPATLAAVATGNPTPSFQWQVRDVNAAAELGFVDLDSTGGGSTGTFTFTPSFASSGSSYRVIASNAFGSVMSGVTVIQVTPIAPTFGSALLAPATRVGETGTFSIAGQGTPAPTCQWQRQESSVVNAPWVNIAGASTTSTLTLANLHVSDHGDLVRVIATNPGGSITSAPAAISVFLEAAIAVPPASASVMLGTAAIFTVSTVGFPAPTITWETKATAFGSAWVAQPNTGGSSVPGTFVYQTTSPLDAGLQVRVTASNASASVTSDAVVLLVTLTPPSITSASLVDATAMVGTNVTFLATATGNPLPTLQWQMAAAATPGTFVAVAGATAASFTLAATEANQGAYVRVVATNAAGSATGNAAQVRVQVPPRQLVTSFDTTPASIVLLGVTTSLTLSVVSCVGTPVPTYQWQTSPDTTSAFVNLTGQTASSLVLVPGLNLQGRRYCVVASNVGGSVTSSSTTIVVQQLPAFSTSVPIAQTVQAGQPVTFACSVSAGVPAPSLQWQVADASFSPPVFVSIAGATGASYTIDTTSPDDTNHLYACLATNAAAPAGVASVAALLTVNAAAPVFSTSPVPRTVNTGQPVTFMCSVTGIPAPTLQWRVADASLATPVFADIPGATSTSYTLATTTPADTNHLYAVVARNSVVPAGVSSATALLTVSSAAPTFSLAPASQTVALGQSVTFTCAATGIPAPTLQWCVADAALSTPIFVDIPGATSSSYTLATATVSDTNRLYVCVAHNSIAPAGVLSAAALLTVTLAAPTFSLAPTSQTIVVGQPVTFTCVATGIPAPTLQWRVADASLAAPIFVDIPGATAASYTLAATAVANTNHLYAAFASNVIQANVSSVSALLTISYAAPTFTLAPTSQSITTGQPASCTITVAGIPTPTVRWRTATAATPTVFSDIAGATSTTLTLATTSSALNGQRYEAVATNLVSIAGGVPSAPAILTVLPLPPTITADLTPTVSGVSGSTLVLAVAITGASALQWQAALSPGPPTTSFSDIPGETSASLSLTLGPTIDQVVYRLVAINAGGTTTSIATTLTVAPPE